MNIYILVSGIRRLQISEEDYQIGLSLDALGCWRYPTSLGCLSSDQEDPRGCSRGLTEVTQHGVMAKKNTHVRFPSQFPPPRSPVNLFCEILRRVSASLAAPPSPETRSLRRAQLIFARWNCDRMESGERGDDQGGVMWCRSGKSEWELIVCCGSQRL